MRATGQQTTHLEQKTSLSLVFFCGPNLPFEEMHLLGMHKALETHQGLSRPPATFEMSKADFEV